jgi:hypothetical protein
MANKFNDNSKLIFKVCQNSIVFAIYALLPRGKFLKKDTRF